MIKNGEFCVYNGNEYELNEDNDGKLIIITTNREIIDATFVDEYKAQSQNLWDLGFLT